MTINRRISIGVLWCFCLCNSVQAQDIKVPLAHLKGHRYASSLSPSAAALLRKQTAILDTKDSFPAILQLWIAGETEYIELLWWRKDDRETRAFIVALFYCRYFVPEDDSAFWPDITPDFSLDATRFASPEREMRIEEAKFVRTRHYSALANEIDTVLTQSGTERARSIAAHYRVIAKMKIGQALPK